MLGSGRRPIFGRRRDNRFIAVVQSVYPDYRLKLFAACIVTGPFAERPFFFALIRQKLTFDGDFRVSRNGQARKLTFQRPLTGLATSLEKIKKNPGQVQRMVRAFLRATRALKAERAGFIAFAQKKYGYSKDVMEEAYRYLIDALSQDGFVDDGSLQAAIDEAKALAKSNKPVNQTDVVDYSFLRAAIKK